MLAFYITVGVLAALLFVFLLVRVIWNIRLNNYQKKSGIERSRVNRYQFRANVVSMTLLLLVGVLSVVGGASTFNKTRPVALKFTAITQDGVTYENARSFSSQEELEKIFAQIQNNNKTDYRNYLDGIMFSPDAPKDSHNAAPEAGEPDSTSSTQDKPNIADTYNQVDGVSESDIAKVHEIGKYLLYAPMDFRDRIFKVPLNEMGNHIGEFEALILENTSIHNMILYKDRLIVFGYERVYYEGSGQGTDASADMVEPMPYIYRRPYRYEAKYIIIDTNNLQILKTEKLNGYIRDVRLTEGVLYLFVNEYLRFDENGKLLPMDFESLYYFKGENNSTSIARIYSVDLKDNNFTTKKIGFIGENQTIYMGNGMIVLTNYKWKQTGQMWFEFYNTTQVIAVSYDKDGNMAYIGSQEVEGYLRDQYFLDVYEGMIRVVTTFGKNRTNHLYILKPMGNVDTLKIIGHLTEGLGKPGEDVKSVTFTPEYAKVVTFLQTDPLYTIDITDPANPIIVDAIEEPGFSQVLFTWDDPKHTIGIGFMADLDGRVIGIKVSAYTDSSQKPYTIEFLYDEWSMHSDVMYNPRENLLIDRANGTFGFIVHHSFMKQDQDGVYSYHYAKNILMFKVDFNSQDKLVLNIEMLEIFKNMQAFDFEKLVIVNGTMHILSAKKDLTWDLVNNRLNEPLNFYRNEIQ